MGFLSANDRFVWQDGDFTVTPPEPGAKKLDPPKGPFDPIAAKLKKAQDKKQQ
jgi:hypothetical protein